MARRIQVFSDPDRFAAGAIGRPGQRTFFLQVVDGDRVLLLHRRPERGDFWQPVSGTIDDDESPLATARREVIEETGQTAAPLPLDLTQSFLIESQFLASRYPAPIIASEVVFHAGLDSSRPIRIDPLEHDDWGWFPLAEAFGKIRWSDDRDALERLAIATATDPVSPGTRSLPRSPSLQPD